MVLRTAVWWASTHQWRRCRPLEEAPTYGVIGLLLVCVWVGTWPYTHTHTHMRRERGGERTGATTSVTSAWMPSAPAHIFNSLSLSPSLARLIYIDCARRYYRTARLWCGGVADTTGCKLLELTRRRRRRRSTYYKYSSNLWPRN